MPPSPRRRLPPSLIAAAALAAVAGGCSDPYNSAVTTHPTTPATTTHTTGESPLGIARRTGEIPSTRPADSSQRTSSHARSAREAIAAFAKTFINWRWDTLARHERALAAASTGQARSTMRQAAASARRDPGLARAKVTNHGRVAAIAPATDRAGYFYVVTRERSGSDSGDYKGLKPAYHVTLAHAVRSRTGAWAVSRWQPEN